MSRRNPEVTLRQIAEYARWSQDLCTRSSLKEIVADWEKRAAFERIMEVLGEAVKRLPTELTSRYPQIDWRGVAGMRDRVSHGYDAVDYDVLWRAVQTQVPMLLATVERIIEELPSGK